MVNAIIVGLVILAALMWAAMTAKELPEDKLDESVKVEEHPDNEG